MPVAGELVIALVMVVGLVGVILPVLPGLALVAAAVVFWAFQVGTGAAWVVTVVVLGVLGLGTVVKYLLPGRELRASEADATTWLLAGVLAVVGFFVVPILGLVLGFVLGTYLGERRRLGAHDPAWRATRRLLAGIGKGIAVELAAGVAGIATWAMAVLAGWA